MASFGVTQQQLADEATARALADSTHAADMTAVHGIADTSKLATFDASNPADTVISAQTGLPVVAGSGSALPTASGAGQAPVSTGAGTTYTAQDIATQTELTAALALKQDASTAATDAELTAGLATKQDLDADLTAIAGLSPSNDDLVQRKAGAWTNRTPAQVKTDLALAKGDVGLGNVDNTSDANKPVSTAQQTALDLKAPLASPALTGTPTAPTPTAGDNDTSIATTAFVAAADTIVTANTQTVDYTLVLTDAGKSIDVDSASARIVTIPPNASVAFPVGTVIEIARLGAGTVTITPGAAVTIPNRVQAAGTSSRTISNQYGAASIRKTATNVWVLVGDIA